MATANGTGAAVRPNLSEGCTREGGIDHHNTDGLTGMAWWNSLTDEQRAAALAAAETATPAKAWTHAATAPEHAATLRDLDGWMAASGMDDGHPWRLSIEQALANEPLAGMPVAAPAKRTPDAERLDLVRRAAWQIEALMDLIVGAATEKGDDVSLSLAIRGRDLVGAVMYAIDDSGTDLDHLHHQVRGTRRATEGATS